MHTINAHIHTYVCTDLQNLCVLMWQNQGSVVRALSRGPMLWTSASHAGFTTASSPWLPVHPSYHTVNVEVIYSLYCIYHHRPEDTLKTPCMFYVMYIL